MEFRNFVSHFICTQNLRWKVQPCSSQICCGRHEHILIFFSTSLHIKRKQGQAEFGQIFIVNFLILLDDKLRLIFGNFLHILGSLLNPQCNVTCPQIYLCCQRGRRLISLDLITERRQIEGCPRIEKSTKVQNLQYNSSFTNILLTKK